MIPEERGFPQFAWGIGRGLYVAVLSDVNVFLLVNAAALLGGGKRRNALGRVLLCYVAFRRMDDYVGLMASKLDKIASLRDNDRSYIHP